MMALEIQNRLFKISMLSVGNFLRGMASVGPAVILTPFAISIGADLTMAGLAYGILYIVTAIFNVVFGILGDRIGLKLPIFLGTMMLGVGDIFYASMGDVTHLILLRAIVGVGGAALACYGAGYPRLFSKKNYAVSLALFVSVMPFGTFLGSTLAGPIVAAYGYRMVFYIMGILGIIAAIVTPFGIVERPRNAPGEQKDEPKGRSLWQILQNRNLLIVLIRTILMMLVYGTTMAFSALIMRNLGAPTELMTLGAGMMRLGQACLAFPVAYFIVRRIGAKIPCLFGSALFTSALPIMAFGYIAGQWELALLASIIFGIGTGFQAQTTSLGTFEFSAGEKARALGLIYFCVQIPSSFTWATGWLLQTTGYPTTYLVFTVLMAIGTLLILLARDMK